MKAMLQDILGEEGMNNLCLLLKETGSLIAGGSVLHAYRRSQDEMLFDPITIDIDIYVPIRNATSFLNRFVNDPVASILRTPIDRKHAYNSSLYCNSFLQKNGIKKVRSYLLSKQESNVPRSFDIMIVRNRRTPLEVVNNFDLTFCQIWFDGEHIYASHPTHVKEKKGILQGEYVDLFLQGNQFLRARVEKYGARGYSTSLDPARMSENVYPMLQNKNICKKPEQALMLARWASRVLVQWFSHVRDTIFVHDASLPSSMDHSNILIVPLRVNKSSHHFRSIRNDLGNVWGEYDNATEDDGYDSEEFGDNSALLDMSFDRYKEKEETPTELAQPTDTLKQLIFHRKANKLLEIALWSVEYTVDRHDEWKHNLVFFSLGKLLQKARENVDEKPDVLERLETYEQALRTRCVRRGTSIFSSEEEEDAILYDIHEHPWEAGISAEDMEGYLQHHITDKDKSVVPCYYQPHQVKAHPSNCKKPLTMSEVRAIVSHEFYDKYSAPIPKKLGLDQFMSHYNVTLKNAKDDTPGWGLMYHHSVCPFCIQFDSRDSGCAYMTHENSKGSPSSSAPFCDHTLQIPELVERYKAVSNRGEAAHLEFCSECGRPCVDHAHITTSPPYTQIDVTLVTDAEGNQHHDYVSCVGGGRAELFARILAIRRVYRDGATLDPKEERRLAALAADDAPNQPDLMAQGAEILAQEEATRHWTNAPVPDTKPYDDPAYKNNIGNMSPIAHESNHEGGKQRRRTYKKKRNNRK
jgi:hypothetical protein